MKFLIAFALSVMALVASVSHAHRPAPYPGPGRGLFLYELGFSYTGPGCFYRGPANVMPAHTWYALNNGGVVVQTTQGYRIMTSFDPLYLARNLYRVQRNDIVAAVPGGFALYPRYGFVPYGAVEVFQTPVEAGLCY